MTTARVLTSKAQTLCLSRHVVTLQTAHADVDQQCWRCPTLHPAARFPQSGPDAATTTTLMACLCAVSPSRRPAVSISSSPRQKRLSLGQVFLMSGEGPDWQRTARFETPRLDPAYRERSDEPIEPNKTLAVQTASQCWSSAVQF
jgi:hypothetical protein